MALKFIAIIKREGDKSVDFISYVCHYNNKSELFFKGINFCPSLSFFSTGHIRFNLRHTNLHRDRELLHGNFNKHKEK